MKKEFLDVYERPEAEEVTLNMESTILSNTETPSCPTYFTCRDDSDFCIDDEGKRR